MNACVIAVRSAEMRQMRKDVKNFLLSAPFASDLSGASPRSGLERNGAVDYKLSLHSTPQPKFHFLRTSHLILYPDFSIGPTYHDKLVSP